MMTEEQFLPGPQLVLAKPGANFPLGMLVPWPCCTLGLDLQVPFADRQSKWQRNLSTQSKPVTKQTCHYS